MTSDPYPMPATEVVDRDAPRGPCGDSVAVRTAKGTADWWLLAAAILLAGCSGLQGSPEPGRHHGAAAPLVADTAATAVAITAAEEPEAAAAWQQPAAGVRWRLIERDQPRPLRMVVARIDLDQPGLELVTTAPAGREDADTLGLRTSTFLRQTGAVLAINAAPFSPVRTLENQPHEIVGWHVHDGRVVSAGAGQATLVIDHRGRADIRRLAADADTAGVRWAVSGFGEVVVDGRVTGADDQLHPRTGAGVSRDGRTLWLVVVDGRQRGFSEGMTTAELGGLLRELGAWQGLNLDGGGTSTIVVADDEAGARVLNRPIHGGVPGLERPSASHLGVRLDPDGAGGG